MILTDRIAHLEAQVQRYSTLEKKHATALKRTRAARRKVEAALEAERRRLGAEIAAVKELTEERQGHGSRDY